MSFEKAIEALAQHLNSILLTSVAQKNHEYELAQKMKIRRRQVEEMYQMKIATQWGQVWSTILGACTPEIVVSAYGWAIW